MEALQQPEETPGDEPPALPADSRSLPQVVSFRDPAGSCHIHGDRVIRWVLAEHAAALDAFLATACARKFAASGRMVGTARVPTTNDLPHPAASPIAGMPPARENFIAYEHERIPFPSYPHEWPPEMLHAAGELTLDLAAEALAEGYLPKDATPANVLFRGCSPVFIDVLSFERRNPHDLVWKPYAQFVRTFLLPLLANRHWGLRLADIFTNHWDGLTPAEVYPLVPWLRRLTPPFLGLITLPVWLAPKNHQPALYQPWQADDPEKVNFILASLLKRTRRALERLRPSAARPSPWSDYMATHSYSELAFQVKVEFVRQALQELKPKRVLDVGANTGFFSIQAAEARAQVVALDFDPACAGAIWRQARERKLDILPLVVDISRPSPALGWRNHECLSFLDRARGQFDGVLMLAVLHHLLVTKRVPLEAVLSLALELTRDWLLIECITPEDPMFKQLARGREHLHRDFTLPAFEAACRRQAEIVRSTRVEQTHRWLYLLRKRSRNQT